MSFVNEPNFPKDSGSARLKQIVAMPELLNAFVNTFRSIFLGQLLKYFIYMQYVYLQGSVL